MLFADWLCFLRCIQAIIYSSSHSLFIYGALLFIMSLAWLFFLDIFHLYWIKDFSYINELSSNLIFLCLKFLVFHDNIYLFFMWLGKLYKWLCSTVDHSLCFVFWKYIFFYYTSTKRCVTLITRSKLLNSKAGVIRDMYF